ncbi:unnamed protein product [Prorocentrum cordatum]|uniref:Uncharacterized protein n=1 Tax=Prorocentrum cordatum TaxID=2364126 RepID=A0ABN9VWM8_9DINO|nr:unnamed protein product [Polarella glacialis]
MGRTVPESCNPAVFAGGLRSPSPTPARSLKPPCERSRGEWAIFGAACRESSQPRFLLARLLASAFSMSPCVPSFPPLASAAQHGARRPVGAGARGGTMVPPCPRRSGAALPARPASPAASRGSAPPPLAGTGQVRIHGGVDEGMDAFAARDLVPAAVTTKTMGSGS